MNVSRWVQNMFQTKRPRLYDIWNILGFPDRLQIYIDTCRQIKKVHAQKGTEYTILWLFERHVSDLHRIFVLLSTGEWMQWIQEWAEWISVPSPTQVKHTLTIGIIPDGNRRWGKQYKLGPHFGHFYGSMRIMECVRSAILDDRIGHLVIYVMSYDNIQKRDEQEQAYLYEILVGWVQELIWLTQYGLIDISIHGEPSEPVRQKLGGLLDLTQPRDPARDEITRISLLIGYDGRREIQQAKGDPARLWIQDPIDGVIRTGGVHRASGFCTYQTGYSEWLFKDHMWPDTTPARFNEYVTEIMNSTRTQNYGK